MRRTRRFERCSNRRPEDASAHHNRGIVLMKARRHEEAVQAYQESLRYRPNYAGTYLNLGYALGTAAVSARPRQHGGRRPNWHRMIRQPRKSLRP